jgi:putative serine protease PepD
VHPGDVITAIDGSPVASASDLIVAIRSHVPGDTIELTVSRGGSATKLSVTLGGTRE